MPFPDEIQEKTHNIYLPPPFVQVVVTVPICAKDRRMRPQSVKNGRGMQQRSMAMKGMVPCVYNGKARFHFAPQVLSRIRAWKSRFLRNCRVPHMLPTVTKMQSLCRNNKYDMDHKVLILKGIFLKDPGITEQRCQL
jgi:hypothetical protein